MAKSQFLSGRWIIKVDIYDVFVGESAAGNPCGVLELEHWLPDEKLQQITCEIGMPVTSFICKTEGHFHIRWYSSDGEINLCGHGSLGAGAAILAKYNLDNVVFRSEHGEVTVSRKEGFYSLVLPGWRPDFCDVPSEIAALSDDIIDAFHTRDLILVLSSAESVANFLPDNDRIKNLNNYHALIVTAAEGEDAYLLRYFAPKIGIPEDLATGSAQCSLAPYWFKKLGSDFLSAYQLSETGGYFKVERISDNSIMVLADAKLRVGT